MTTKLTLSINAGVVEKAKSFLQTGSQSLSGLVEDYFTLLIKTKQQKKIEMPITRELTGIVKSVNKVGEQDIYEYLQEKYK